MKIGLVQMCSSDDPQENLVALTQYLREAAAQGAEFVLTPEVSNCVSASRQRQQEVLQHEAEDDTLKGVQAEAKALGIWVLIGSLALKTDDPDGRFANRSFLIDPNGAIKARYDKIHMFDVEISAAETYRESAGYRPGQTAVVAETDFAPVGLTICYDLRFPYLHRALAQAGAHILTAPAAFSPVSGAAHWEPLLRARAIETGCFILAPAQTGTHGASLGNARKTYGHSLVVSPWGEVLADAGTETGVTMVELDLAMVENSRKKIPSLTHDRTFKGP